MDSGLVRLFSATEYKTTTVRITCYRPSTEEDGRSDKETPENITIELSYSSAASTDFDLTGQILWPVSILLGHYLASSVGQSRIKSRNVVELGAGTGLPGLVAANFATKVVLTDGNEVVLDLLDRNVSQFRSNKRNHCSIKTGQLVWGNRSHLNRLLKTMERVDVVVAADVVQWPAVVEPLLHTVKALLWNSKAERPVFILGIVNRAAMTYDLFFRLAKELGFQYQHVECDAFVPGGVAPESCREFGGRVTEIYEVALVERSIVPVLFQQGHESKDMTVGRSFENTANLPC